MSASVATALGSVPESISQSLHDYKSFSLVTPAVNGLGYDYSSALRNDKPALCETAWESFTKKEIKDANSADSNGLCAAREKALRPSAKLSVDGVCV